MIMKDPCSLALISGACNSNPFAADWGPNNKICVAIEDAVAILQPELDEEIPGKYSSTLFAHTNRVNAVKWIQNLTGTFQNFLVSASVDTTAIVWIWEQENYAPKYVLKGHKDAVIDVQGVSLKLSDDSNCILIATMSIDTLMVWKKSDHEDEFSLLDCYDSPQIGFGASGISFSLLPFTQSLIMVCPKKFVDLAVYSCPLTLEKNNSRAFEEKLVVSGHSNWINDIAVTTIDSGRTILIATSSHDCTIRIWRIVQKDSSESQLSLREYAFSVENKRFVISTWSILHGHDQWIYTLQWKHFEKESKEEEKLKLLSVSADKTAVIWNRDFAAGTWVEQYRLGDLGGNLTGFVGGRFDPTGKYVMANDLLGAFHVWRFNKSTDSWSSEMLPSGHFDEITDLQWDPDGKYLMTTSADKTTRLHAPYKKKPTHWYEFARPQTHGHIISCLTVLPDFRFVSGAAEKELRSFIASKSFIKSIVSSSVFDNIDENKYPHNSAILPSLDLSNKPSEEADNKTIDKVISEGVSRVIPTEDELSRTTLWPEVQKLYYHPNEMSSIICTRDGSLIASACKANSAKEAAVVIWAVKKWDEIERIQELWFHQLTVTQLAFSPCGSYLLSTSRDRSWNLYQRKNNEVNFESIAFSSKNNTIHKRQLNCCAWSHDSKYFATGSRDGKLVIWSQDENDANLTVEKSDCSTNNVSSKLVLTVPDENISSVSFAPEFVNTSEYLFAVGFGSGKIRLYIWSSTKLESTNWLTLSENMAHSKSVVKVVFCPKVRKPNEFELASGGADRLVKIYQLNVGVL